MNKGRRQELKYLKYKKRIRRFVSNIDVYVDKEGKYIYNPKSVDVIQENGQHCYRTTSTPCSCIMCAPDKYVRAKEKEKISKVIEFELNYDCPKYS